MSFYFNEYVCARTFNVYLVGNGNKNDKTQDCLQEAHLNLTGSVAGDVILVLPKEWKATSDVKNE